ncbi:hypothetical protein MBGDN05_00472 [Thermoplasmatales archaeon SCGC AB-539-N05]|nr:hypothetical protein MBGDN05_00472 [Thermoplasmatales archaeon SCGC AB-539-N05]
MKHEEKIKMFNDVFAPKAGEKVLFLVDTPHDNLKDSIVWEDRRKMAKEWYDIFKEMGEQKGFMVDLMEYPATGLHNSIIPKDIIDLACKSNLVIAITEFSASSSLVNIANKSSITRCTSMPMVERRMEQTAFKADYSEVQRHAAALEKILNNAMSADVTFSTGDTLHVDLRYRTAKREAGDCSKLGQLINFPSGEAWKVPYEATPDEIGKFGKSKTEGIQPVSIDGELMKFKIKNNKIIEIDGEGRKAEEMRSFFNENESRRNIAEFAFGCNQKAVVTGNKLEDEKASGLHIGYAMSTQLGGKVESDMHEDIIYAKGCPVEATKVILTNKDGAKTEVIRDSIIRYELLE